MGSGELDHVPLISRRCLTLGIFRNTPRIAFPKKKTRSLVTKHRNPRNHGCTASFFSLTWLMTRDVFEKGQDFKDPHSWSKTELANTHSLLYIWASPTIDLRNPDYTPQNQMKHLGQKKQSFSMGFHEG